MGAVGVWCALVGCLCLVYMYGPSALRPSFSPPPPPPRTQFTHACILMQGDLDGILSAVLPPSSPSPAPSPFHHRTASGGFSALAVASALAQSGSPAPSPARPLLAGSSLLAHVTGTSAPAGQGYLPMVEGGSRGPTPVHSSYSDSEGSVTSDSSVELPISSNPTRERVLAAQRT